MDGDNGNGLANAGESIAYIFDIANNGTKTLSDICLTAANMGTGCLSCMALENGAIFPGDSFSCGLNYEVR